MACHICPPSEERRLVTLQAVLRKASSYAAGVPLRLQGFLVARVEGAAGSPQGPFLEDR